MSDKLTFEKIMDAKQLLQSRPEPFATVVFPRARVAEAIEGHTSTPVTTSRYVDTYAGMRVLTHCMRGFVPRKYHNEKANGGKASYHKRIQKKWNRRYGLINLAEQVYLINERMINNSLMGLFTEQP